MNLYLIFHGRFPSEKAASLFSAKSCEAFADAGLNVTLLVPRRLSRSRKEYSDYYNIKKNFKVIFLPTIDLFDFPIFKKISFAISFWIFSKIACIYLLFSAKKNDIIYSNETLPLFFSSFIFPNTVYEMHDFPKSKIWFYRLFFSRTNSIVSTNNWKRTKLIGDFGLNPKKVFFESNAVDIGIFSLDAEKIELRKKLSLPENKFLIGYAGMLKTMGMEKGIDTAIGAIKLLGPESLLVIIGGSEEDIDFYRVKTQELGVSGQVLFVGWVSHAIIPSYLGACDVLIAPFPSDNHYNFYMSPMKIFEYMASNRPIVASDLNSIREILVDGKSGILVKPGDSQSLATGIKRLKDNENLALSYANEARKVVMEHTWNKRAGRILNFLKR